MMKLSIHAGHCPEGGLGCGAVGILNESAIARGIVAAMKKLLEERKLPYIDCTVEENMAQHQCLDKLVLSMNADICDYNVSVHLNSFPDSKANGSECIIYSLGNSEVFNVAERICTNLSKLGFTNRGVKEDKTLAVLRRTKAKSIVVECFFCTSPADCRIYTAYGAEKVALAILGGLMPEEFFPWENKESDTPKYDIRQLVDEFDGLYKLVLSMKEKIHALKEG